MNVVATKKTWAFEYAGLTAEERALVQLSLEKSSVPAGRVQFRELGRVGRTGARFIVRSVDGGVARVIKIHREGRRIKDEWERVQALKNMFPDLQDAPNALAQRGRAAALMYPHKGVAKLSATDLVLELKDVVFSQNKNDGWLYPTKRVVKVVRKMYVEKLLSPTDGNGKDRFSDDTLELKTEYREYWNRPGAMRRVSCMLGCDADRKHVKYLGRDIVNPTWFLERGKALRQKTRVRVGPVHGDLHPNNVILEQDLGSAHLIDFAWGGEKAHALKDYVLMECSLRFNHFPGHVNLEVQDAVDRMLLDERGSEKLSTSDLGGKRVEDYCRLGNLVHCVRDCAKGLYTDWEEYLGAFFCMLFGLMKFGEYNRVGAIRCLGMVADRLDG